MCDPETTRIKNLQQELERELGTPGKWELLFHNDGTLIEGRAKRIDPGTRVCNPYLETARAAGKPDTVYIRERKGDWPTVPALQEWEVIETFQQAECSDQFPRFYRAGEPAEFRLDPTRARIGILVAGGNAAGLNMVIDSIVKRITALASALEGGRDFRPDIVGYVGGYVGLESCEHFKGVEGEKLTIKDTDPKAGDPCVFLKTLRGRHSFEDVYSVEAQAELEQLANAVQADRLDILFAVGGNGTFTWADRLYQTLKQRNYPIALVGGPKTMDSDINFADATFGFRTAVDNAIECIRTVHWEAETQNRIAVIELFGAASGFVALHAGFLSGVADYIMIPEFEVSDEELFTHLAGRLERRQHAVLVIAEGALAEFRHGNRAQKRQAFTNFVAKLGGRFPTYGLVDIRPRHLIRGTPPDSFDLDLAKYTGYLMADTALAGFTDCSVQLWQGNHVLVPLSTAVARLRQVELWSPYFWYMAQRYFLPDPAAKTTVEKETVLPE